MSRKQTENRKGYFRGRKLLPLVFLFFLLVSGCRTEESVEQESTEKAEESAPRLYVMNPERTKVISEEFDLPDGNLDMQISGILTALEALLWTEEEKAVITDQNPIYEYKVDENGLLTLRFSADYNVASTVTEVLRRAAIVKTVCQLEDITAVEFYIASQPLLNFAGKPVGMLTEKDFIDSTGENTEFYHEAKVTVYFAGASGDALVDVNLNIIYDGTMSTERLVLQQLMDGPISEGMIPIIPKGTVLNKVTIRDGICYVDFNEKFMEKREEITPEVAVYSIVNSLTELSNVYKVQFLINGTARKTYYHLDFSQTFERNLEIVEGEQ